MSDYAPHAVFVAGPLLGVGLFDAQRERFEGAVFLELLEADHPLDPTSWLVEQLESIPAPRAVIAHGLAAASTIAIASDRPDLVDGAVLIGLAEHTGAPDADGSDLAEAIVTAAHVDPGAPEARRARSALDEVATDDLAAALDLWRGLEVGPSLAALALPALLVAGGEDLLAPLESAEALANRRDDAGLAVLPSAGHASPTEAAGAVDLLAAAFLARLELTLAEDGE